VYQKRRGEKKRKEIWTFTNSVDLNPEDGGTMYLQNVGNTAHFHTAHSLKSRLSNEEEFIINTTWLCKNQLELRRP
jgi:hypothetical protein